MIGYIILALIAGVFLGWYSSATINSIIAFAMDVYYDYQLREKIDKSGPMAEEKKKILDSRETQIQNAEQARREQEELNIKLLRKILAKGRNDRGDLRK